MPINPAFAIRVLAREQAKREVKDRLKRAGIKVSGMSAREINALAEEHLRTNADRLLHELQNHPPMVRYREKWQCHQERRSRRVCKS
jgi:hypothetical protein